MSVPRRRFIAGSAASLVAAALRDVRLAARQPAPASFEELRRGVGIFNGRGGTIGYLVTNQGLVVVDTQFPDTAATCLAGLRAKSTKGVEALVNTHHHGDHTGGNPVFKGVARKIVAHTHAVDAQRKVAAQPAAATGPVPEQVYADTTYETAWMMDLGGEHVVVTHYGAGHTGGDSVVTFEKANVVHMGDLMFHRRHPFIDRPMGASVRNWMTLLGKVIADHGRDTWYIAGHAKDGLKIVVTRAEVKTFQDYFAAVIAHVEQGVKAGRPKDEVTRRTSLPGFEDFMDAPPRLTLAGVLSAAYDEISAAP